MTIYRAAIVGCGRMGTDHGRAYAARPDVLLVAAADPNPENLAGFCDLFGIPSASRFADYQELLAREPIDLLGIATPVKVTLHVVLAAAETGVKGIFAEKPIAARLSDADAMVAACRQRGIPFACGAIWRNHPYLREAVRLIQEEDAIGRVISINVLGKEEEVSGVGCHYFNIVRLLARGEIDSAIGWTLGDPFSDHDQGAGGYLHFANGIEAFVHARAGTKAGVEALGEWGVFFWDWNDVYLWRNVSTWDPRLRDFSRLQRIPFPYPRLSYPDIYPGITGGLQSLIEAIEQGGEPHTSGEDMRRVLEVAIALRESARRGRIPVDLPLADRNLTIIPRPERWVGFNPIETG